ncbi:hypothetical protein NXX71_21640 [Bacteroides faecis]|nr:hypothetical protein [Bacteroides faecis]
MEQYVVLLDKLIYNGAERPVEKEVMSEICSVSYRQVMSALRCLQIKGQFPVMFSKKIIVMAA